MNEFAPYASEREAIEAYEDMLNDSYGTVDICGVSYATGRALKEIDPIRFRCGFNDWLDSVQEDCCEDCGAMNGSHLIQCWEADKD